MNAAPGPADAGRLVNEFISARKDRRLVVLEGFHPLKHALRFDADLVRLVTSDDNEWRRLAVRLAPDVANRIAGVAREVPRELFARLAPRPAETGVIALARRPHLDGPRLLVQARRAPLVLLERPSHLGNVG